ncbi:SpoIIIAH-like family protein [Clostridiisalibacter paucivorans]|uniref:SpoIIIAH-like family protein n=1 Tax=Clostridiisalibacter paucivorans TaxID=408753 RepID=UPI00047B9F5C|nr:SpoIIIAH-like family protein [Clostridiisalibacter paucivorans]
MYKKRKLFIGVLCLLLIFIGYINHRLTDESLKETSDGYEIYEEEMMGAYNFEDKESVETSLPNLEIVDEDIEIVDSKDNIETTEDSNEDISASAQIGIKDDYFVKYRMDRDKQREKMIDELKEIVDNKLTAEDMRSETQGKIINLQELSQKELYIEGQIKSKGFNEAVAFLKDDGVTIVVACDKLSEQDAMKILDIAMEETELSASQIKIIEKK